MEFLFETNILIEELDDVIEKIEVPLKHSKSRKRVRHEENWKRNKRKKSVLRGEAHTSSGNKNITIRERKLQPPCNEKCTLCETRLTEDQRQHLFNVYWNKFQTSEERDQFISSLINTFDVKRRRPRTGVKEGARKTSRTYFLIVNNTYHRVCQTMFLNTFDISRNKVSGVLLRTCENGIVRPDNRGRLSEGQRKISDEDVEEVSNRIKRFPRNNSHFLPKRKQCSDPESKAALIYRLHEDQAEKVEDVGEEIVVPLEDLKPRKRVRHKDNWKSNKRLKNVLRGEAHTSSGDKNSIVRERKLQPPCNDTCTLCEARLTEDQRRQLFDIYWNKFQTIEQKDQFISSLIDTFGVKRRRPRTGRKEGARKASRIYYLIVNNTYHRVCQTMFLNTFDISRNKVSGVLSRTSEDGSVRPRRRKSKISEDQIVRDPLAP